MRDIGSRPMDGRRAAALLLALLACGHLTMAQAASEPIVAVLSSESGPYREALEGLREELGESVPSSILSREEPGIPDSARVIVALGAKAALRSYPDRTTLIYAMSPGLDIPSENAINICIEPDARTLLTRLKEIHPGLKRLGILWGSPHFKEYINELRKVGRPLDIAIEDAALKNASEVPDRLRGIYGKIDALWLAPDPLLLNATNLPVFLEFSRSNRIPLFVPTGGLAEEGATASVGPTFREMGRLAGVVARKALKSPPEENKLYTANVEVIINKTAAVHVGLRVTEDVLRKADKVIP